MSRSGWQRVKDCSICGGSRCVETEWIAYCFRYSKAYNKRNLEKKTGIGGQGDIVPLRGVLEGQSPSKQKALEFEKNVTPYDYGL